MERKQQPAMEPDMGARSVEIRMQARPAQASGREASA